ncbi:hypothetical protein AB0B10_25965 [Micromonospora arborensis]|uniref:hypothetical protein n=1 Tax=Micromonospora arborensis TaxID=2116518 RepID=UPI0034037CB6
MTDDDLRLSGYETRGVPVGRGDTLEALREIAQRTGIHGCGSMTWDELVYELNALLDVVQPLTVEVLSRIGSQLHNVRVSLAAQVQHTGRGDLSRTLLDLDPTVRPDTAEHVLAQIALDTATQQEIREAAAQMATCLSAARSGDRVAAGERLGLASDILAEHAGTLVRLVWVNPCTGDLRQGHVSDLAADLREVEEVGLRLDFVHEVQLNGRVQQMPMSYYRSESSTTVTVATSLGSVEATYLSTRRGKPTG